LHSRVGHGTSHETILKEKDRIVIQTMEIE